MQIKFISLFVPSTDTTINLMDKNHSVVLNAVFDCDLHIMFILIVHKHIMSTKTSNVTDEQKTTVHQIILCTCCWLTKTMLNLKNVQHLRNPVKANTLSEKY